MSVQAFQPRTGRFVNFPPPEQAGRPRRIIADCRLHASISNEPKTQQAESTRVGQGDSKTPLSSSIAEVTRSDFPIFKNYPDIIYLDSAATSHKPESVLTAIQDYYTKTNSNVHRGAHSLARKSTAAYEAARDTVAKFVGANSRSEIVFTSGATEAINLVVQTYGRAYLQPGDTVVLTVAEHHANLVPWQILAAEKRLNLQFVGITDEGQLDLVQMESILKETPNVKMVALQHVSNVLSTVHPVETIVELVRRLAAPDCKILLDACQSVPHMPVSVQALGVDFLVASGHKLCGPTGIGFLWGREDLLNAMPPWKGGGEMIDQVTLTGSTWQPTPARFEAGTPAIAQAVGLAAAIDYLTSIGMDRIASYEHELGQYLYDQMVQVPGLQLLGPSNNRAALCAFRHESIHPSDLSTLLDTEGVAVRAGHHCCQPLHTAVGWTHSARASLYFYNTKEYVTNFIHVSFFTNVFPYCRFFFPTS
jgi:cysteine desulfurase / selenocysteine lyase